MATSTPKGSLSTLAETAEEYIKLECVRRRNQPLTRRRSMLQEQFQVVAPSSRLKERVAQTRHHEFLLRKENKTALDAILDRVRDLMEELSVVPASTSSSSTDRRRSSATPILNPMDRARLQAWVGTTERIVIDFEPSDSHENDPVVRIVEQLQKLQDGPVCLAEIVVDARALLERWERSGVFDDDSSDDEESDTDAPTGRVQSVTRPPRQLDQSYAYQNVRQRAAANCIKRNVLRWMRSKESFCERVAEIELFGQTTESLLKELTSTSKSFAVSMENESPQDIFSVVRGRRVDRHANSISLSDLMHFAKHVALYPVDQALRTLDVMARKRRLLDMRSAVKIQAIWRKAQRVIRARRLFEAMEQLRIQREQEAAALAELLAMSKASTPKSGTGKRKSTKPIAKKLRASIALQSATNTAATATETAESEDSGENVRPRSKGASLEGRVRASMLAAKRKVSESAVNDQRTPTNGTPRGKQREHDNHAHQYADEVVDTSDVENAWRAFMDSVEAQEENGENTATDAVFDPTAENVVEDVIPTVPEVIISISSVDDEGWNNWSDDEDGGSFPSDRITAEETEDESPRVKTSTSEQSELDKLSKLTRSPTRREQPPRENTQHDSEASWQRLTKQPETSENTRRFRSRFGAIVSTADLIKRLEQRPRLDRPSILVPFADWQTITDDQATRTLLASPTTPASVASSLSVISSSRPLRHLHEMDFSRMYTELEGMYALQPLVDELPDEYSDAWQQAQEVRLVASPSMAPTIAPSHPNNTRHHVTKTRFVVQKSSGSANHKVDEAVYTTEARSIQSPRDESTPQGIRIYRAPVSRQQKMLVKRPDLAGPSPADDEVVQGKMAEHSEWIRSLDRQASPGLTTLTSVPTSQIRPPGMPMGRKRRLRPSRPHLANKVQDGNQLFHQHESKLQHNNLKSRDTLPHLYTSRSDKTEENHHGSKDISGEVPNQDAITQVPLHEIRRYQKLRSEDTSPVASRADPRSGVKGETNNEGYSNLEPPKADSTRGAQTVTAPNYDHDDTPEFDARFMSSRASGRVQRKWRLPQQKTGREPAGVLNSRDEKEARSNRRPVIPSSRKHIDQEIRAARGRPVNMEKLPSVSALEGVGFTPPSELGRRKQGLSPSSSPHSAEVETDSTHVDGNSFRHPLLAKLSKHAEKSPHRVEPHQHPTSNPPESIPILEPTPAPLKSTHPPLDDARSAVFRKLLQQYLGLLQCPGPRP